MRHDGKNDKAVQRQQAGAAPQGRSSGRDALQFALQGGNYDQQRQLVSPDGSTPAEQETADTEPSAKPKNGQVILSAKSGGSPFTRSFWQDLDVGHCWVDVVKPDGRRDSWGYTATDVYNFPVSQPWKSVEGEVLHPDGSRGATGTLSAAVDEDQLAKAESWGNAQGTKYNLFGLDGGHSCATFAKDFYEEASGQSAPTGMFGALIANPNSLSDAMNKHAEKNRDKDDDDVEGEASP